jgi:hypothetical protein
MSDLTQGLPQSLAEFFDAPAIVQQICKRADDDARRYRDSKYLEKVIAGIDEQAKACKAPECPSGCGCALNEEIRKLLVVEMERRNPTLPGMREQP